ncbi:hypothetical protein imdm_37 [gamma proteobacterium IMCC2047]|nr:hypothetical protein imdm_37 [gamma proteobacterium IMCC2047]
MYKNKGELMQDRLAICTVIRAMPPLLHQVKQRQILLITPKEPQI